MAKKARQFFTVSSPDTGVVLWDTTLRPLCLQFKDHDSEALSYSTLFLEMKDVDHFEFTTKSGVKYIIQKLVRD